MRANAASIIAPAAPTVQRADAPESWAAEVAGAEDDAACAGSGERVVDAAAATKVDEAVEVDDKAAEDSSASSVDSSSPPLGSESGPSSSSGGLAQSPDRAVDPDC